MNPVFIGGTGRSGTTILKRVLTHHSKIVSIPVELRIIIDPGGALDLISSVCERWSPYNADIAIQRFQGMLLDAGRARSKLSISFEKLEKILSNTLGISTRRYLGLGLSYHFGVSFYYQRIEELIDELCYHVTRGKWTGSVPFRLRGKIYEISPMERVPVQSILTRFFNDLYMQLANDGQPIWLDDTPYNLLHIKELNQLFPKMRLLHIYRDPRDVLASYSTFKWGGDDYISTARRISNILSRWFELKNTSSNLSCLEVSLEALAADPRENLKKICDFIGLNFEDNLMEIPLDKVNAGRWKRDIPEREMEKSLPYLLRYIRAYGYNDC